MRGRGLLWIHVLILVLTLMSLTNTRGQGFHIYMFGTSGCPICIKMKMELEQVFGSGSVTYYDIIERTEYAKAYLLIYELLPLNLTRKPLPLTGVFSGGRLVLIVLGYRSIDFWEKIPKTTFKKRSSRIRTW